MTRLEIYKEITYTGMGEDNPERYLLLCYDRDEDRVTSTHESLEEASLTAELNYPNYDSFSLYDLDDEGKEIQYRTELIVEFYKE
jgi:hypothetical protein